MKKIFCKIVLLYGLLHSFTVQAQENATEEVGENVEGALSTATEVLSPANILTIFAVLLTVWLTIKALDFLFDYLANRLNRYRLRIRRMQPVAKIIVWAVAIYSVVMTLFNPEPQAVYALLASSALALGFASQDLLKNIFGGFMIIFDNPFQLGDRISIDGNYGEVVNIGMRTTQINTLDDSIVTIPNSKIINTNVSNANTGALDCMVVVNLWLPIHINAAQVKKIAYEAAVTSKYLNIDKGVNVLFFDTFDKQAATNVKVKAYVLDARYEKAFESDVTEAAKKAFNEAKIY